MVPDIAMIMDNIGHFLSSPVFVVIVIIIFIMRVLYVISRYISVSDITFLPRRQKTVQIELLERSNISLRDKDTALYCRLKLTDNKGRPVVHRKVNLLLCKKNHPLSSSSFKGSTYSISDKNGICEYCGITIFEQGIVNAVLETDRIKAYLDGIDLTSVIIKRNSMQKSITGLFDKNPEKRLGFYNSKLDSILTMSTDIAANRQAHMENKTSNIILNLFGLIPIVILLVSLFNLPLVAVLTIYLFDIILFGVLTSNAKKKYEGAKINIKNISNYREVLHKDIIYIYNELYYDLGALVHDSGAFEKEPMDLQDKCCNLAKYVSINESVSLSAD